MAVAEKALFIIPFLHQTTTAIDGCTHDKRLFIIPFLHQTTTCRCLCSAARRCSLFLFYIKPQRSWEGIVVHPVVHYSFSTSNHNKSKKNVKKFWLFIIPFLHQTTTTSKSLSSLPSCSLFLFYIKPQLNKLAHAFLLVVHYSFSTSNHNGYVFKSTNMRLFIIPFLHQTTTQVFSYWNSESCSLFLFYIKPQPKWWYKFEHFCCSLFLFYIKPQLPARSTISRSVVHYSFSTSNHNCKRVDLLLC